MDRPQRLLVLVALAGLAFSAWVLVSPFVGAQPIGGGGGDTACLTCTPDAVLDANEFRVYTGGSPNPKLRIRDNFTPGVDCSFGACGTSGGGATARNWNTTAGSCFFWQSNDATSCITYNGVRDQGWKIGDTQVLRVEESGVSIGGNPCKNWGKLATQPTTTNACDTYYNSTGSGAFCIYNGTGWDKVGAGNC